MKENMADPGDPVNQNDRVADNFSGENDMDGTSVVLDETSIKDSNNEKDSENHNRANSSSEAKESDGSLGSEADMKDKDKAPDFVEGEILQLQTEDGIAFFGDAAALESLIMDLELPADEIQDIVPNTIERLLGSQYMAGTILKGFSEVVEASGAYLKLTPEGRAQVKAKGLYQSKEGINYAIIGKPGKVDQWLQVENGLSAVLSNPAMLSNIGGIMTQLAIQKSINEITGYLEQNIQKLESLAKKLEKDQITRLEGVYSSLQTSINRRNQVGGVDATLWGKVSTYDAPIESARRYALGEIAEIAESLDKVHSLSDLETVLDLAESNLPKWLALVAYIRQSELWFDELELEYRHSVSPGTYQLHLESVREEQEKDLNKSISALNKLLGGIEKAVTVADAKLFWNHASAIQCQGRLQRIELKVFRLMQALDSNFERSQTPIRALNKRERTLAKTVEKAKATGPATLGVVLARYVAEHPEQVRNAGTTLFKLIRR
ncbi:hypothetical protein ACG98H_10420 [Corynebacterium sp. L4756]|uniref:hypothetical protein n=1 Tax=unclassified Corynebacterium TaxID=2624378 RepID=UPI00374D03FA